MFFGFKRAVELQRAQVLAEVEAHLPLRIFKDVGLLKGFDIRGWGRVEGWSEGGTYPPPN